MHVDPQVAQSQHAAETSPLRVEQQRISPYRGLVLTHNERGKPLPLVDIRRWMRYCRLVLKTQKLDILVRGDGTYPVPELLRTAEELELRLSYRTEGTEPPPDLAAFKKAGLYDIFLTPPDLSDPVVGTWLQAARAARLPVRLLLLLPLADDLDPATESAWLAESGVVVVDLAVSDPFVENSKPHSKRGGQYAIELAQRFARALEDRGIEANIIGVPLCIVNNDHLPRTLNQPQLALDHSHYSLASRILAKKIQKYPPFLIGQTIRMMLGRDTFQRQPVDTWLLTWLLRHNYLWLLGRMWRRFTMHLRRRKESLLTASPAVDTELLRTLPTSEDSLNRVCAECALRKVCDHETAAFTRTFPDLRIRAREGELVVSPLHFATSQAKYYDELDAERLAAIRRWEDLPEQAIRIVTGTEPDAILGPADYSVEDAHFDRMESGIKWWALTSSEQLSTPLPPVSPPFTISVDFGAGIADYIGFSFGRHCKILCPMEAYRHNLTLHVDEEGHYVLIRDRQSVRPTELESGMFLPLRLGDRLIPRISVWNIDGAIATQNVRIWHGKQEERRDLPDPKYSIIIVSTRFTRRLHAVFRSLAHQQDFDMNGVEIIVCYVPGLDATDDLIDSVTLAYPNLRVIRNAFPEKRIHSKGFMINEAFKLARGDWIMLLDSDTLLPPGYFARIEEVSERAEFIAPDGRRLLDRTTTARILMGELDPWNRWEELVVGDGEFRFRETQGIPVGFCQCFRRKYLEMFPYMEVEHFETADMHFGLLMRKELGEEYRLSGMPVLHLDHGGSQWYGAQKHM